MSLLEISPGLLCGRFYLGAAERFVREVDGLCREFCIEFGIRVGQSRGLRLSLFRSLPRRDLGCLACGWLCRWFRCDFWMFGGRRILKSGVGPFYRDLE